MRIVDVVFPVSTPYKERHQFQARYIRSALMTESSKMTFVYRFVTRLLETRSNKSCRSRNTEGGKEFCFTWPKTRHIRRANASSWNLQHGLVLDDSYAELNFPWIDLHYLHNEPSKCKTRRQGNERNVTHLHTARNRKHPRPQPREHVKDILLRYLHVSKFG
jgi:hypothetical protein